MTSEPTANQGFGHSPRRLAVELGGVALGVIALAALIWWLIRSLPGWLVSVVPTHVDESLGEQSWSLLAPQSERCTNAELNGYLESLTQPLVASVSSPFSFKFTVVDAPEVNAFALPGGFVTVNLGLLQKAESGEEIAGVLAHELAHVTLRHGTQRMLRQLGTAVVIGVVLGGTDIQVTAALLADIAVTAYGRDEESEADATGVATLKAAGIDALGMSRFFERMASDASHLALPAFLSTHPDPGDRAERTRQAAAGGPVRQKLPPPPSLKCH